MSMDSFVVQLFKSVSQLTLGADMMNTNATTVGSSSSPSSSPLESFELEALIASLSTLSLKSVYDFIINFLLFDRLAVIHPFCRIFVYFSLFLCATKFTGGFASGEAAGGDTALQAHGIMKHVRPMFWRKQNALASVFLMMHNYNFVRALTRIAYVAWICCIIGFGGIYSRVTLGVLIAVLHSINFSVMKLGVSHNWLTPTWSINFMIFTTFSSYSVDALITSYYPAWQHMMEFDSRYHHIFDSSFTSKMIGTVTIYTLFAGGVSKVRKNFWKWIHPSTIQFYLCDDSYIIADKVPLSHLRIWMRKFIATYRPLCTGLALFSLLLECGSISALFSSSLSYRWMMIIGAWKFHFGIYMTMGPMYLPQSLCYTAFVFTTAMFDDVATMTLPTSETVQLTTLSLVMVGLALFVLCGYLFALIFQYEGYPFTYIPMYSHHRVGFSVNYIMDKRQLHEIVNGYDYNREYNYTHGCEDQMLENDKWIRIVVNDQTTPYTNTIGCTFSEGHHFRWCILSAFIRSYKYESEFMNEYMHKLKALCLEKKMLKETDHLHFQVGYKSGFETYASTEPKKVLTR